jgi:hypothetical protein
MLDDFLEFSTTVSVAQLGTSGSSKMTVLLACLAPCEFRSWQGAREKSGCKAKLFHIKIAWIQIIDVESILIIARY